MNTNTLIYTGIGKRKTSVAKVFLKEGSGNFLINNKSVDTYFLNLKEERESLKIPFLLTNLINKYDLIIKIKGGGINAQLEAIKLAISKAICKVNIEYRLPLKQEMLLTRDSRIKERRKYGLKKARKASQYSKR
jgi:small subunit ribosomal protein S9